MCSRAEWLVVERQFGAPSAAVDGGSQVPFHLFAPSQVAPKDGEMEWRVNRIEVSHPALGLPPETQLAPDMYAPAMTVTGRPRFRCLELLGDSVR